MRPGPAHRGLNCHVGGPPTTRRRAAPSRGLAARTPETWLLERQWHALSQWGSSPPGTRTPNPLIKRAELSALPCSTAPPNTAHCWSGISPSASMLGRAAPCWLVSEPMDAPWTHIGVDLPLRQDTSDERRMSAWQHHSRNIKGKQPSPRRRREFTPEFKRDAVELVRTSGRPIAQIAKELGMVLAADGGSYAFLSAVAGALAKDTLDDDWRTPMTHDAATQIAMKTRRGRLRLGTSDMRPVTSSAHLSDSTGTPPSLRTTSDAVYIRMETQCNRRAGFTINPRISLGILGPIHVCLC
jgi:hypothetical protein